MRIPNSDLSIGELELILARDPTNVDNLRELGLLHLVQGSYVSAQKYLRLAIEKSKYADKEAVWNYATSLHFNGEGESARLFMEKYYHSYSKDIDTILLTGRMNLCNGHVVTAEQRFEEALSFSPSRDVVHHQILVFYEEAMIFSGAERYLRRALRMFPENFGVVFQSAILLFNAGHVEEAMALFQRSSRLDQHNLLQASLMVGACYQAMGNIDEAKATYQRLLELEGLDTTSHSYVSLLANYGLLLKNSEDSDEAERGVSLIELALQLDPAFETALVNLALHYQSIDDRDKAVVYLKRAAATSMNARQLEIDIANTIDEVMFSWERVLAQRRAMFSSLTQLLEKGPPSAQYFREYHVLSLHFNIQYHSFNDKHLQELMFKVYEMNIKHVSHISPLISPHFYQQNLVHQSSSTLPDDRVKIGFLSKSFGVLEPHAMLLDGVVKYLPRSLFKVFILCVAQDNKASSLQLTSPSLVDFADEMVEIPQALSLAAKIVQELRLDVLVFADSLCEPVSHFLMMSRFAKIQILFWGNPITSGSPHVDYFLSSDFMEHPYRPRLTPDSEPYSEQVLLLPGQGIWYSSPNSSEFQKNILFLENKTAAVRDFSRGEFGLDPDWFVYLCPQNLFKLHVFYDGVIASILERSPDAHVVFIVPSRRKTLTEKFKKRLRASLNESFVRCHFLPRVSSEQFVNFIKIGDVLLHPFPFDGSRISADSLTAGIPYVTLPTEYLKGRMGASFYRTMNMPELVAEDVSEYIDIAVRLSLDHEFLKEVRELISTRSWLIFDDMEVPFAWCQFFLRALGEGSMSWVDFLEGSSDRDVREETRRSEIRRRNQEQFDDRRGPERWLLDERGLAVLEEDVVGIAPPRIFNNWNKQKDNTIETALRHNNSRGKQSGDLASFEEQFLAFRKIALSGKPTEAYGVGSRLLERSPRNSVLNYELGVMKYYLEDYDGALSHCGTAAENLLAEDKEDRHVYGCLGVTAAFIAAKESRGRMQQITSASHIQDIASFALRRARELRELPSHMDTVFLAFPMSTIEFYLIASLLQYDSETDCLEEAANILRLPAFSQGGAHVLLFSLVNWTAPTALALLDEVDANLKHQGLLKFSDPSTSLLSEVQRVQASHMHVIEPAFACGQLHPHSGVVEASSALAHVLEFTRGREVESFHESEVSNDSTPEDIVLVTQWTQQKPIGAGQRTEASRVQKALVRNLMNPFITQVHLAAAAEVDVTHLPNSHKLCQHVSNKTNGDGWLLETAAEVAGTVLQDCTVIIAGADIYFDQSLRLLAVSQQEKQVVDRVMVLSSWTEGSCASPAQEGTPELSFSARLGSHRAWVFRGHVNECIVTAMSSAHKVDAEIFRLCGYSVSNPSYFLRAIQVQCVDGNDSSEGCQQVSTQLGGVKKGNIVLLEDSVTAAKL